MRRGLRSSSLTWPVSHFAQLNREKMLPVASNLAAHITGVVRRWSPLQHMQSFVSGCLPDAWQEGLHKYGAAPHRSDRGRCLRLRMRAEQWQQPTLMWQHGNNVGNKASSWLCFWHRRTRHLMCFTFSEPVISKQNISRVHKESIRAFSWNKTTYCM